MDKETLEALQGSIKKWEDIAAGKLADKGVANCPLCKKFYKGIGVKSNCIGCPVANKTNKGLCIGTPYTKFKWAPPDQKKACAQEEVDFLKSLLPKEDDKEVELTVEKDKVLELVKKKPEYKEALKTIFPEVFVDDEVEIKFGGKLHIFQHIDGPYYVLARVDSGELNFINLKTGNRWSAPFNEKTPITKKFLEKRGLTYIEEEINIEKLINESLSKVKSELFEYHTNTEEEYLCYYDQTIIIKNN